MVSNSFVLERSALSRRLEPGALGGAVAWVIAPGGYGKTTLLEATAAARTRAGVPALLVSVAECEAHLGLFVDALVRGLRGFELGVDVTLLLERRDRERDEGCGWLRPAFAWALASVDDAPRVALFVDDVDRLEPGEPLTRELAQLVASPPEGLEIVLAGRSMPEMGGGVPAEPALDKGDLALSEEEVRSLLAARLGRIEPARASQVWQQTSGWPAMVDLVATAFAAGGGDALVGGDDGGAALVDRLVDRVVAPLNPQARFVASLAAVVGRFEPPIIIAIAAAEVAGPPSARRRMVRLSQPVTRAALAELRDRQLLAPAAEATGMLTLNPLTRRSLRERFLAQDEAAYREAHRRAAELLLLDERRHGVAPFDLLLEAREYDRLGSLLEARAEALYVEGFTARLEVWLKALAARYPAEPAGWIDYYLGRIATLGGRWEQARLHLERARRALTQGQGAEQTWRWQPRLSLAHAVMLWRRGALSEALTWCRRGLDFVAVAERRGQVPRAGEAEVRALKVELQSLAAHTAMEISNYERSRAELEAALALAAAPEFARVRAQILVWLARNALRAAEADACASWLDEAEPALAAAADDEVRGLAHAVRAELDTLRGDLEAAGLAAEASREAAERAGGSAGLVRAYSAVAAVARARGDADEALTWFDAAEPIAATSVRVDLHGELACRHALALFAVGDVRAQGRFKEANEILRPIVRLDGYLAGLNGELLAEERLRHERAPRNAIRYLEAARETFFRFGAELDVARLHWRQAELHLAQVEAGQEEAAESVLAQLEDACVIAEERGLRLPDEPRRRDLAVIGASVGEEEVLAYCAGVARRQGVSLDALGDADQARIAPFRAIRGAAVGGEYRWVGRDAAGALGRAEYEALLKDGEEDTLLAFVEEQVLWNCGVFVSLGQKRIMMPLLLQFLRAPGEAFSMRELARDIWQTAAIDGSVQTKVKVAISRLRSLLGKERAYVATTRKQEDGADVVAYQLAPGLAFRIISASQGVERL